MNKIRIIMLLLFLSFIKVLPGWTQSERTADAKTKNVLDQFREGYTKSYQEKNPSILLSWYADNIRLMPEFQKTVMSKRNALSYHNAFLARFEVKAYQRKNWEIVDLGTMVMETGKMTMTIKSGNNGNEYTINGKYLNIWEKKDDQLLLVTEAWNYDHSLEMEEQFRFPEVPVQDVALQAHLPVNSNISFELAALNKLMETAVTQHDQSTWLQFYSQDAMFCYSRHPVYKGKIAIGAFLGEHVKELPVFEKLDIRNDQIYQLDTYVIEYASHIANWRNGASSGVGLGKDLRIWRREKDGSLKIFRHIGMYD